MEKFLWVIGNSQLFSMPGQKETAYDRAETSKKIWISYQQAALFEDTIIEADEKTELSISGNNVDGFIITEWEKVER